MLKNNPILLGLKSQLGDKAINKPESTNKKNNTANKYNHAKNTNKQSENAVKTTEEKIIGWVKSSAKTYGFLETESGKDYFITPKDMHKVFAGDYIKAKVKIKQPEGSLQATPVELLEPSKQKFIGQLNKTTDGDKIVILKNNNHVLYKIKNIPQELEDHSWIQAELSEHYLQKNKEFNFTFKQFLATDKDPWLKWKETLVNLDLPIRPMQIADKEFEIMQNTHWDSADRVDLTDLDFFTIDGSFTKDMDDAIYVEQQNDEKTPWRLIVAIADPDIYIKKDSLISAHAMRAGTSIYLPGNQDTPMFPKNITENICSLQPNEIKPVLVCDMQITSEGEILENFKFYLAKISSKYKLNYNQVSDFLETGTAENLDESIKNKLGQFYALSQARLAWREKTNFVNDTGVKFYFDVNANAEVVSINEEQKLKSHQMIEEAMLAANYLGGEFLQKNALKAVYINYSGFAPEKIGQLKKFLTNQNIDCENLDLTNITDYKKLQAEISNHKDAKYIEYFIRRYQSMVNISDKSEPHFGLGFNSYSNWTAPIRRYGDLTNHRIIKHFLASGEQYKFEDNLIDILQESRKTIRSAEREINNFLYFKFLKDKTNEFEGEIYLITKGGMRVSLVENGASVFIPISLISHDSNSINLDINTGKVFIKDNMIYKLGDRVKIKFVKSTKNTNYSLVGAITQ